MRRASGGRRRLSGIYGALMFFVLVTVILQISVLIYDYIRDRTDNNLHIALLMLNVIIILAGICTLCDALRRRVMVDKPVGRILEATQRIAAGDFSVRLKPDHVYGKYTEYDIIMEDLNTMAKELGKSEMLKSDFISNVSHELKTPLAVISNCATMLRDESLPPEERARHADTLTAATARLSGLVTDILRLNKLENQATRETFHEFDLSALFAEVIIGYEDILERKDLTLTCDIEENVRIRSVRGYLETVLSNLLSNAIKFTDEGGEIAVACHADEKYVTVSVRDTGCGISPDEGARIFEKFYQADSSHAREGNGLGLALVKRIIDILGGEISVESEVGKGSLFTVRLPRNPDEI